MIQFGSEDLRGRAKSESDDGSGGRFVDADGEIDLDPIQAEELRGLGIEPETSNKPRRHPWS